MLMVNITWEKSAMGINFNTGLLDLYNYILQKLGTAEHTNPNPRHNIFTDTIDTSL